MKKQVDASSYTISWDTTRAQRNISCVAPLAAARFFKPQVHIAPRTSVPQAAVSGL